MKSLIQPPLTKREIAQLTAAAEELSSVTPRIGYRYSCTAVRESCGSILGELYGLTTGASMYHRDFQSANNLTDFEAQLARSLAVLMFIEANR